MRGLLVRMTGGQSRKHETRGVAVHRGLVRGWTDIRDSFCNATPRAAHMTALLGLYIESSLDFENEICVYTLLCHPAHEKGENRGTVEHVACAPT